MNDNPDRAGLDAAGAQYRLATYGTLAPGRANHHQLDGLHGRWIQGHVHGRLIQAGWGASLGYPAITLEPDGPMVQVQIFESSDLPDHWARLDKFEGDGYRRTPTILRTPTGEVEGYIYALVSSRDSKLTDDF